MQKEAENPEYTENYGGWTKFWIKAKSPKETITLPVMQMDVNSTGICNETENHMVSIFSVLPTSQADTVLRAPGIVTHLSFMHSLNSCHFTDETIKAPRR